MVLPARRCRELTFIDGQNARPAIISMLISGGNFKEENAPKPCGIVYGGTGYRIIGNVESNALGGILK